MNMALLLGCFGRTDEREHIPKRTMVAEKAATMVENPHSFMIA